MRKRSRHFEDEDSHIDDYQWQRRLLGTSLANRLQKALGDRRLDAACQAKLQALGDKAVPLVADVLDHKELASVHNVSAFFTSIVKRAQAKVLPPQNLGDMRRLRPQPPAEPPADVIARNVQRQQMLGVRVNELHLLSAYAQQLHPSVAKYLQDVWDAGTQLVGDLDEAAWSALCAVSAVQALAIVDDVLKEYPRNCSGLVVDLARQCLRRSSDGYRGSHCGCD